MNTTTTTTGALPTQSALKNGQIIPGIRCLQNHSGNHAIARTRRGFGQCQGCGNFFSEAQMKSPSRGQIGNGGVGTQEAR